MDQSTRPDGRREVGDVVDVSTRQRRLRGLLTYVGAIVAVFVVVAVAAVVLDAAHRASAAAAVRDARVFQVTVRAETVDGALSILQGHRVQARLTDNSLGATSAPSATARVTSLDTDVVTLSMAGADGAPWWNVVPSVRQVDHEKVPSVGGDGVLVITDWETYATDADTGGGAMAALAGWRVQWGDAAPGEYVIETPVRWVPASSTTGEASGPVQVRVHITVIEER